jgi:uncharacterized protein (DUF2062 family)
MCPFCMTNVAVVVAGATSGAGVLGFVAVKVRTLRRHRRKNNREQGEKREAEQR